jgi:hypothetical protein
MYLRISLTGAFAIALLDWFRRAKTAATGTGQQSLAASNAFLHSVEVIPGKLSVKIFRHDITFEGETIPCWSYVTDGFVAQRQKESILTLRRESDPKPEDYPRGFLELFARLFRYTQRGQPVDVGDSALFNDDDFLPDKNIRGIGYVEPQGLLGIETGALPLLAAILLKGDEAQVAWSFGLTRVTALIDMKYRSYPCPIWSDLKREVSITAGSLWQNVQVNPQSSGVKRCTSSL